MSNLARGKSGRPVNEAGFYPPVAAPFVVLGGVVMLKLETADEGGENAPYVFDAALFFSFFRAAGGDPQIRSGGIYRQAARRTPALREVCAWAAIHDPNGAIRMEYVRQQWEACAGGSTVVYLG
jgi:hypothetical protein